MKIHYLGARGAEVRYNNTLALLEPDRPGLVADFVAERGQGILGGERAGGGFMVEMVE